tara:strand:- start:172 stop:516 length:345 start_codon:yes stop_codon:yes gene_type:complete
MAGPKIKGSKEYRYGYSEGQKVPTTIKKEWEKIKSSFSGNVKRKAKSKNLQKYGGENALIHTLEGDPLVDFIIGKDKKKKIQKSKTDYNKGFERGKKEGKSKKLAKKYFRGGLV